MSRRKARQRDVRYALMMRRIDRRKWRWLDVEYRGVREVLSGRFPGTPHQPGWQNGGGYR